MPAPKRPLRRLLRRLAGDCSGNALILMAVGMPMLIGGAGLGVDFAQW
jgi:Flp pilus assembly protein TadG